MPADESKNDTVEAVKNGGRLFTRAVASPLSVFVVVHGTWRHCPSFSLVLQQDVA